MDGPNFTQLSVTSLFWWYQCLVWGTPFSICLTVLCLSELYVKPWRCFLSKVYYDKSKGLGWRMNILDRVQTWSRWLYIVLLFRLRHGVVNLLYALLFQCLPIAMPKFKCSWCFHEYALLRSLCRFKMKVGQKLEILWHHTQHNQHCKDYCLFLAESNIQ